MIEIVFNADKCKKDGLCAMACPRGILTQEEKRTMPKIVDEYLQKCFRCGQCVAICPHEAITHSHFPAGTVNPVKSENLPTYDQVLELMHSRRTKRAFKAKTVEKDVIEKVLEAARFAPSGHNEQTTEFVVVRDRKTLDEIGKITAEGLAKTAQQFKNPIGRMIMRFVLGKRGSAYVNKLAPELEGLASLYDEGTDWILRKAPVLVLFCANSQGGNMTNINANLAAQNAMLAAEAVGLGCLYTGFVVLVSTRDDRIAKLVSLPDTHRIFGAFVMGYPRLKFKKWPERNPAKVNWVGFE